MAEDINNAIAVLYNLDSPIIIYLNDKISFNARYGELIDENIIYK